MNMFEPYLSPVIGERLADLMATTFVGEGEIVQNFERSLSSTFGLKNVIGLNSGTSALHLALVLANVHPGDEVIIPAQTFVATGLAVKMIGAVPVFADIEIDTGNIKIESIEEKITERTKAVIAVHWGGYPCDLIRLQQICRKYDLKLIEDAAHAIGASFEGVAIGAISDFTAFSFQAIKHLTTGDGGALCCKSNEDFKRGKRLRWFGISKDDPLNELGERQYRLNEVGFKYHMNNVAATIGLCNLEGLSDRLAKRRIRADWLTDELNSIGDLSLHDYKSGRVSSFWFFPLRTARQSELIKHLINDNYIASVVNQGIDRHPIFGGADVQLLNQRKYENSFVALPMHDNISDSMFAGMVDSIKSFF